MSDLTSPRFEPRTSRSWDELIIARPTDRVSNKLIWSNKMIAIKLSLLVKVIHVCYFCWFVGVAQLVQQTPLNLFATSSYNPVEGQLSHITYFK